MSITITLKLTVADEDIPRAVANEIADIAEWQDFLKQRLPGALGGHVQDEVRYLANLYLQQKQQKRRCPHRRTVLDTTGGMHYSAGDVEDDIRERLVCLDCQTVIPPRWRSWKRRVKRYYNIPAEAEAEVSF